MCYMDTMIHVRMDTKTVARIDQEVAFVRQKMGESNRSVIVRRAVAWYFSAIGESYLKKNKARGRPRRNADGNKGATVQPRKGRSPKD
jgi:hypothetical protein